MSQNDTNNKNTYIRARSVYPKETESMNVTMYFNQAEVIELATEFAKLAESEDGAALGLYVKEINGSKGTFKAASVAVRSGKRNTAPAPGNFTAKPAATTTQDKIAALKNRMGQTRA